MVDETKGDQSVLVHDNILEVLQHEFGGIARMLTTVMCGLSVQHAYCQSDICDMHAGSVTKR